MLPLPQAIDDLYRAFQRYPLRANTNPCPCCISRAEERLLHAAPLRLLPAEHLVGFAWHVMNTWGSLPDLKHFLPRMFEITAGRGFPWATDEVVFSKLRRGEWRSWPAAEQKACEAFLLAWWLDRIGRPFPGGSYAPAEGYLCSVAQALEVLTPLLQLWLRLPGENVARHLAAFVYFDALQLENAFWPGAAFDPQGALYDFARSRPVIDRLEQAFFTASSAPVELELSRALDVCLAAA